MHNFKIKNSQLVKKSFGLESIMLGVYTLSSRIPISLSTTYNQCQGTNLNHSGPVGRKGNSQNVKQRPLWRSLITLSYHFNSNNHKPIIIHAKSAASAIEKKSILAGNSIKKFTAWGNWCWGTILLGKSVTVEVSVGEISGWGSCCWGN